MKNKIGLILLTLGIGLTAAMGSQLSPDFKVQLTRSGDAELRQARSERRHKAYCKARKQAKLKLAEGCSRGERTAHLVNPKRLQGISKAKRAGRIVMALERRTPKLPAAVAGKRSAWLKALKKEKSAHRRLEKLGEQGPIARLYGWAAQSGLGFGFGLLLVIAGAWVSRVASRKALGDSSSEGGDAGLEDFGVLLGSIIERTAALHQEMVGLEAPTTADLDRIKTKLEDIQRGDLARLCESGPKVQQRYGQAGFAEIFSPLSAGERKLNRLWSTLVDRHWPESLSSAEGALAELRAALEVIDRLGSS